MVAFGRPFYREGLISKATLMRGLYAQLVYMQLGASEQKLARIRESLLTLTKGWERDQVAGIVAETLEGIIDPIIYGEALELIEAHRAAGRLVLIVSASVEEIVAPLARYLGVDRAIASRASVDDDGRYTGEMAFYAYGPYKAQAMRDMARAEGIDLAASYAYSDSYTDMPMLEAVGHPVAVNPDRVLAKLARERGWPVRNFVRPVPLRPESRAGGRVRAGITATAVALTAATAVVAVIGRHRATGARPAAQSPAAQSIVTTKRPAWRPPGAAAWRPPGAAAGREVSRLGASSPPRRRDQPGPRAKRASSWSKRLLPLAASRHGRAPA